MSKLLKTILTEADISDVNEFNELAKTIKAAKAEFMKKRFQMIMKQEYELEQLGKVAKAMYNYEINNKKLLKEKLSKKKCNGYVWITINPKPDVTLQAFKKLIKKIVLKTCFTDYLAVLEQRGTIEEKLGSGFHAHILFKRNLNYKPAKCITNLKNSCKNYVGNINNQHQFNYKVIGEDFAKDKKIYILGQNKTGDGKQPKQAADRIWRQKENIDEYLGNKNII